MKIVNLHFLLLVLMTLTGCMNSIKEDKKPVDETGAF